jgi:transposase
MPTCINFTTEDEQYIIVNYETMSKLAIARRLGISETAVYTKAKKLGLYKPNRRKDLAALRERRIAFIEKNHGKMSYNQMAKALNCSIYTIGRLVNQYLDLGIKTNNQYSNTGSKCWSCSLTPIECLWLRKQLDDVEPIAEYNMEIKLRKTKYGNTIATVKKCGNYRQKEAQ